METNEEESESWYYFIRKDGNEENLEYLQKQLEKVDWYVYNGLSTFDLELNYPVSAQTAKEMTKVDLNHKSFHRKFDGELKKIDLGFKAGSKNKKKMKQAFDVLGYGRIEDYIDQEDVDQEDLDSNPQSSDSEIPEASSSDDDSEAEEDEDDDTQEEEGGVRNVTELPKAIKVGGMRKKTIRK